jgi:hypothetical protein
MGNLEYRIQMKDSALAKFGAAIITAGGNVYVCKAGLPDKQPLVDKNGATLANPLTPTRGFINFFIPDTVTAGVDLYVQFPGGQFKVVKGVQPSGPNEISTDTSKSEQLMEIPFSIADTAAATESATGFVVPPNSMFLDRLHGMGLEVTVAETTGAKTVDVGTAEANAAGGDSDGFQAQDSTASLGMVIGTNGAFFSTNAPATSTALVANLNIVVVIVTAAVTTKGFALQPYRLTV